MVNEGDLTRIPDIDRIPRVDENSRDIHRTLNSQINRSSRILIRPNKMAVAALFFFALSLTPNLASSQELVVQLGANVSIPCGQPEDDFSNNFIVWKKGEENFALINKNQVLVNRSQIQDKKDLFITNASKSDMAQYECTVNTSPPKKFTYMLEVHYPPIVDIHPNVEELKVKKGDNVKIVCNVDGNPAPDITWSKEGQDLNSQNLKIDFDTLMWSDSGIDTDATGIYVCLASNGELQNVRKRIKIIVQSVPELEVMPYINGAPGKQINLTCKFRGLPTVKVSWLKDDKLITPSSDKTLQLNEPVESSDMIASSLIIHKMSEQDFDSTFTCIGVNELGKAETNLTIKGIPEIVKIHKIQDQIDEGDTNSATIEFSSISHSPLYEFKLTLTEAHNKKFIKEIMIPADPNKQNHKQFFELSGLRSNAEYEIKMRAKNQYGWSQNSQGSTFFTNSIKEPSLRSAKASPTSHATSSRLIFTLPSALLLATLTFHYSWLL